MKKVIIVVIVLVVIAVIGYFVWKKYGTKTEDTEIASASSEPNPSFDDPNNEVAPLV